METNLLEIRYTNIIKLILLIYATTVGAIVAVTTIGFYFNQSNYSIQLNIVPTKNENKVGSHVMVYIVDGGYKSLWLTVGLWDLHLHGCKLTLILGNPSQNVDMGIKGVHELTSNG